MVLETAQKVFLDQRTHQITVRLEKTEKLPVKMPVGQLPASSKAKQPAIAAPAPEFKEVSDTVYKVGGRQCPCTLFL